MVQFEFVLPSKSAHMVTVTCRPVLVFGPIPLTLFAIVFYGQHIVHSIITEGMYIPEYSNSI